MKGDYNVVPEWFSENVESGLVNKGLGVGRLLVQTTLGAHSKLGNQPH